MLSCLYLRSFYTIRQHSVTVSVADPGFPPGAPTLGGGGGAPGYDFIKIS